MLASRIRWAVALALVAAPSAFAQTVTLAEPVRAGDCFHYRLEMTLKGQLHIQKNGESASLPLDAAGGHTLDERILAVGATGLPEKSARGYAAAKVIIRVGNDRSERTLRPERSLLVAQRGKDQSIVYCPAGGLRRGELELTSEHFDTLALTGLLPGKEVKVGDTWKLPNLVAQSLCNFEGLSEQSLTGKLESVKDGAATFSVSGSASGIDDGAMVKLSVEATGQFDLTAKQLVNLEWRQKDERQQGPVSPASTVETTTKVTRKTIEQPATLSDVALVSVPDKEPPSAMLNLECADANGRFELMHPREWQMVSQTADHLVLRLVERGDFIAQATITPWKAAEKGKHLSPEEFKQAMNATPGWEPERELQSTEVPLEGDGRWAYRTSVQGQLDGVAVVQNFYLLAAPSGEQVVVAVTMTPKQADKLGARDLTLVASLVLPAATAGK
jgi:hypothetical protein